MFETVVERPGTVTVKATIRTVGIYLDNFSLIDLAKGNAERRQRIIRVFQNGADLLFSPTNAAEVIGPEHRSSLDALTAFLDAIGPYWFPVEGPDFSAVLKREADGTDIVQAGLSSWFLQDFFASRSIHLYGQQRLEPVEPDFFRLGFVLEWLVPHRARIRQSLATFDRTLAEQLTRLRRAYEEKPREFDCHLPVQVYDPSRPASFAWWGLLRSLVLEAKAYHFKNGDGADLSHAVMGTAFASYATLDKQWKRRVMGLPQPNRLAHVYGPGELDRLITDVEAELRN